jgi:hypothetical protein
VRLRKETWVELWTGGTYGRFLVEWVLGFSGTFALLALLNLCWEYLR